MISIFYCIRLCTFTQRDAAGGPYSNSWSSIHTHVRESERAHRTAHTETPPSPMSHTRATPTGTAKARRVRFHRASRVAHTRHHRAPPGASSTTRPLLAALAPASGRVSIPQSGALTVVTLSLRVSAVTTDTAVCVSLSRRGPGSARTRVHSQLHHMTVRNSASTPHAAPRLSTSAVRLCSLPEAFVQ